MWVAAVARSVKRFYILWLYAVTLMAFAVASIHSTLEEDRLRAEAESRAAALAISIEDSVVSDFNAKHLNRIAKLVQRLRMQQRVLGLTLCPEAQTPQERSTLRRARPPVGFPRGAGWESLCRSPMARKSGAKNTDVHWTANDMKRQFLYYAHPITLTPDSANVSHATTLIVVYDISYLRGRWFQSFVRMLLLSWISGAAVLLLATAQLRTALKSQLRHIHQTVRSLVAGRPPLPLPPSELPPDLQPISKDMDKLVAKVLSLADFRTVHLSQEKDSTWLTSLRKSMKNRKLIVIANREPYIHQYAGAQIQVIRPASGLVTALEPILRQCGGLWIAHGSGSADVETADAQGEIAVPPSHPTYTLRRVWLTKEEEAGYYYGFANEGLWPLCHLAHTRPIFRLSDWNHYRAANQKFSDAVPESALGEDSLILVQDYHFALLPRMLKERKRKTADATAVSPKIGIFWHIPWPNPEAFGICPWNQELLRGMLGADVIGFHTQYHCNNFLETCNRYLEARIDWENFSVTMENHTTFVRAFPIGIDTTPVRSITEQEREQLKAHYGIKAEWVAVGVDRMDYTKGLLERVEAVERFLEKNPKYVGKFTFVQMGSPSRSNIAAYRTMVDELVAAVQRVNNRFTSRFSRTGYRPVILLPQHHDWTEIRYFYQLGDICLVTSLHDGMNLVAKEYVWCQRPDRGSLILSKFTGASRELTEAFIVNPYSIEEMADAITASLTLPAEERERRMTALREKVQARNAYHWASDLINALIRKDDKVPAKPVDVRIHSEHHGNVPVIPPRNSPGEPLAPVESTPA